MKKRKSWVYAMYKGEEILAIGTREEICKKMNIKTQTFRYYRTNIYKERLKNRKNKNSRIIIRIDNI
jgi:hypothetical protein